MSDVNYVNRMSANAVYRALNLLDDLNARLEDKTEGFYISGDPRLWHYDGWSPGYFGTIDGIWVFYTDYEENL